MFECDWCLIVSCILKMSTAGQLFNLFVCHVRVSSDIFGYRPFVTELVSSYSLAYNPVILMRCYVFTEATGSRQDMSNTHPVYSRVKFSIYVCLVCTSNIVRCWTGDHQSGLNSSSICVVEDLLTKFMGDMKAV